MAERLAHNCKMCIPFSHAPMQAKTEEVVLLSELVPELHARIGAAASRKHILSAANHTPPPPAPLE